MSKKVSRKWNIIIPLGISIVLCVYLIVSMVIAIVKPNQKYLINTIGELDAKTTYQLFEKEDRDTPLEFKDYFFYGESFNFYLNTYEQNNVSATKMNLKLVDWLNEENVISFTNLNTNVDGGVDLSQLKDGFYSAYVENGEILQRLYFNEKLDFNFYTVTRDNQRKQIRFICDAEFFHLAEDEKNDTVLDNNYLYIQVKTVNVSANIYDVVISVDPSLTSNKVSANGYIENGITEKKELLEVAEIIKTDLEAKGLKVLVLSCSVDNNKHENDVLFYKTDISEKSVLQQIYESKAKYMLHLDLDETKNAGFVHYSNYASDSFAKSVFDALQTANLDGSIGPCSKSETNDYVYEIRESGGKALSAATYSTSSAKNVFALNNIYGLNTIEVSYGNIKIEKRVQTYLTNKQAWAHATALGVINYITKTSEN